MFKRPSTLNIAKRNSSLNLFVLFLLPLSLILLGDGILSYIFPVILDNHLSSNFLTGLILSLSSVVGIAFDFLIPVIFPKKGWKFQLILGIILAIGFPIAIAIGHIFSLIWLFVLAVIIWGIYFEFLTFAQQSFIVQEERQQNYSRSWGVVEILTDIVCILAPILGALLLIKGTLTYTAIIIGVEFIALLLAALLVFIKRDIPSSKPKSKIVEVINTIKQLRYWKILSKKIYIILIMAVFIELLSASFWVFGGLFGIELINNEDWNWIILLVATVPTIFGSFIVSKLNIRHHKKRYSQIAMIIGGLLLTLIIFFKGAVIPILIIIFLSNFAISFCWPLNDAIFSDLQKRLKDKQIYLIGLASASYSFAYIISPSLMGFLSDKLGYYNAFAILGLTTAIVGIILMLITPRKLRIPHKEIETVV